MIIPNAFSRKTAELATMEMPMRKFAKNVMKFVKPAVRKTIAQVATIFNICTKDLAIPLALFRPLPRLG